MCVYEEVCYVEGSQCIEYVHTTCECGESFCLPREAAESLSAKYCSRCTPKDSKQIKL